MDTMITGFCSTILESKILVFTLCLPLYKAQRAYHWTPQLCFVTVMFVVFVLPVKHDPVKSSQQFVGKNYTLADKVPESHDTCVEAFLKPGFVSSY